ncbi:hypothetical protein ANOM_001508 [Aspergillus nomiae NRRL 13137]|uniref:Uncharacterized protein n=1 Tax=Aspergillus nomiae NRRL (strain ATCC 15546 / NRRL 13137 / CBS 260.88 / M93) TaxID=1509407 RepID=A0A0L1JFL9_ASPN3|nr:uncharacterized protein ANOM_001508 [Aspergillus nomiae NRRL 13137]KNG90541.1 hypothetical protein ANOM_001508 [Aspergillus nomiae NRRL 13137]
MLVGVAFLFLGAVAANPVIPREDGSSTPTPTLTISSSVPASSPSDACATSSTSSQWLSTCNTTIFWPTSTNYYYGPTTGPEASAVSCNAEWVEYDGRASGLESLGATSTSTIYSTYVTSTGACNTQIWGEGWDDPHAGPVTTLCDGIPRALGPREYSTTYWPGTGPCSSFIATETTTTLVYRSPSPTPAARSIPKTASPSGKLTAASARPTLTPKLPIHHEKLHREGPLHQLSLPARHRDTLLLARNHHQRRPLSAERKHRPSHPDGRRPNTAVVNGHTFVSPSIYVSFTSIYARSNQRAHPGGSCGGEYEDVIISVDPTAVSSYRSHINAKYPTIGTAYPFEYDEFQPHTVGNYTMPLIPWEKYQAPRSVPSAAATSVVYPSRQHGASRRRSGVPAHWRRRGQRPDAYAGGAESGVAAPTPEATVW